MAMDKEEPVNFTAGGVTTVWIPWARSVIRRACKDSVGKDVALPLTMGIDRAIAVYASTRGEPDAIAIERCGARRA